MATKQTIVKTDGTPFKGNVLFESKVPTAKGKFTSVWSSNPSNEHIVLDLSKLAGNSTTPVGYVAMFYGKTIPTGWAICDGTNGTQDLRDAFIMGTATEADIGKTGGTNDSKVTAHKHTITFSTIGNHTHVSDPITVTSSAAGGHSHTQAIEKSSTTSKNPACQWFDKDTKMPKQFYAWDRFVGVKSGNTTPRKEMSGAAGNHTHYADFPNKALSNAGGHTHTLVCSTEGQKENGLNRPPFYGLVYIQKIK